MRTTHDINLDHHGLLDPSRIDGSFSSAAPLGSAVGRYYPTDSLASVLAGVDERLTALEHGYAIMAGSLSAGSFVQPYFTAWAWIQPTFEASAFIQPYFTADAEIAP